jgi:tetratricopeptide (TPR) repeat protein
VLNFTFSVRAVALLIVSAAATVAFVQSDQLEATRSYNRALKYRGSGQHREAIEELKSTIKKHPSFSRAYSRLMTLCQQQGDPDEARRFLRELLESDPKNPYRLFGVGLLLKQDGRPDEAEQHLLKSIEISSDFVPAYKELVEIAHQKGQLESLELSLSSRAARTDAERAAAEFVEISIGRSSI